MGLQNIFLVFSLTLTVLFFVYGFNHYYLLMSARKYISPQIPDEAASYRPMVAIHLPIYNEKYVIRRLVEACARAVERYGINQAKIVIVDDSNDDTREIVDELVLDYRQKGFLIESLRRANREGYKAGALQAALSQAEEEFLAIFDADFLPPDDFLVNTLPFFYQDERLGIIQSRWGHINRDYNSLTRAIATGIDVHFLVEQSGRYAAGCFQNFNGSGGIFRKKALVEAGGWQADTLAEDLDASYRVQVRGYRILYLRELQSPGEVPPTVPSYKKQQGRWACGSLRTAKKLLPDLVVDRRISLKQRAEAFIHLTAYMVHPLMFISFVLACLATLLNVDIFRFAYVYSRIQSMVALSSMSASLNLSPRLLLWILIGLMIVLCTVAAWIPPLVALRGQRLSVGRKLLNFLFLYLLGCGVSLSNTIEAGKALLTNQDWAFRRTPKYAIAYLKDGWRDKKYQVSLDYVWGLELASVCLGGYSIGYSIWHANLGVLIVLVPLTAAYGFVCLLTILQSR